MSRVTLKGVGLGGPGGVKIREHGVLRASLVTNSIRHVANSDVAFTGNGTLRDEIRPGATGIQRVSDLFRVASLGLSLQDDSPGYPITKFFVTGRDLKNFTEVLLIAPTLKGGNFFPRFSGMRVHHNPQRIPLDKIYDIEIGDIRTGYESIDLSDSSDKLYSVATTTYVAGFIWVVEKLSHGLLSVIPRNADGEPLKDLQGAIFDVAPQQSGVQQVKEWEAMLEYLKSVPERTPDGLADMDAMPTIREEHVFRSTSPMTLLKNATYLMWTALVSILLVVSTGGLLISRRLRRSES